MFPSSTKFLIVDDLKTIRQILKRVLKNLGFANITDAEDGEAALVKLRAAIANKDPYDVVISDWNMPKKTGLELLREMRGDPDMKETAFLFLTIEAEREYVLKAIEEGCDEFIVKPFEARSVEQKLSNVYRRLEGRK